MSTKFIISTALGLGLLATASQTAYALNDKDVITTIAPLQSLIANLTKGVVEPQLLIRPGQSPHTFVLKPSDARRLAQAKIIFWFGPQLEEVLAKPIKNISDKAMEVHFLPDMKDTDKEDHDKEAAGEEHAGHDDGHHHHGGINPHIWLNPMDAKEIVEKAAAALIRKDPAHKASYRANLATTLKRLDKLDANLQQKLKSAPAIFVFHDAYAHFAERYHIKIKGVVLNNPSIPASAKQAKKIQSQMIKAKARCVFAEPQFNSKILTSITTGSNIKTGTLDPLGADLKPGPDQYFKLLNNLATNIMACGR